MGQESAETQTQTLLDWSFVTRTTVPLSKYSRDKVPLQMRYRRHQSQQLLVSTSHETDTRTKRGQERERDSDHTRKKNPSQVAHVEIPFPFIGQRLIVRERKEFNL
jgi:hypothetical protein